MKRLLLICLFLGVSGCATDLSSFKKEWADVQTEAYSLAISPTCPAQYGEGQCGVLADAFYASIPARTKECQALGETEKECQKKVMQTYGAQLILRYPQADWSAVDLDCKAQGNYCGFQNATSAKLYELVLIKHHNKTIAQKLNARRQDIDQRAANYDWQQRQARAQVWSNAFSDKKQVNCRSYAVGNAVNTDCQ